MDTHCHSNYSDYFPLGSPAISAAATAITDTPLDPPTMANISNSAAENCCSSGNKRIKNKRIALGPRNPDNHSAEGAKGFQHLASLPYAAM